MPAKLKNLEVTSVDFVDAGANPGAKISLYKRADEKTDSEETVLSKFAKSIGVSEEEFTDAFVSSLTATVEKFSKAGEVNTPAVNDDEEEKNSEPIEDNPEDDPTKKVDEKFAKSEEKEVEEKSMENDLRKNSTRYSLPQSRALKKVLKLKKPKKLPI